MGNPPWFSIVTMLVYQRVLYYFHQAFQVPKMEVLTKISCIDTACGYGKTHPQNGRL